MGRLSVGGAMTGLCYKDHPGCSVDSGVEEGESEVGRQHWGEASAPFHIGASRERMPLTLHVEPFVESLLGVHSHKHPQGEIKLGRQSSFILPFLNCLFL